jgi:hypothetical protein
MYPISSVSRWRQYLSVQGLGSECVFGSRQKRSSILKKWMLDCADSEAESETLDGVDWDNFGFGLRPTDAMFVMKCERGEEWQKGELRPYGNLELSPSAAVLNYGQVRLQSLIMIKML